MNGKGFQCYRRYMYLENNLMFISVCLLVTIFQTIGLSLNIKRYEICRPFSKKTVYTSIGSRGIIFAKSDILNHSKSNVNTYVYNTYMPYLLYNNTRNNF